MIIDIIKEIDSVECYEKNESESYIAIWSFYCVQQHLNVLLFNDFNFWFWDFILLFTFK